MAGKPIIVIERHLNCEREHVVGDTCWCRPRVEDHGGTLVVIHNAPAALPDPPDGA